jgi:hypothetical protein
MERGCVKGQGAGCILSKPLLGTGIGEQATWQPRRPGEALPSRRVTSTAHRPPPTATASPLPPPSSGWLLGRSRGGSR